MRDVDGTIYVLEDNLRVPSGVSYMLENRLVTKRVFADLFRDLDIQPVDDYSNKLSGLLATLSPRPGETPVIVVLTPGIFNSAYFEHAFLAQQMGAHLVEGKDLVVDSDDCVYMRTIGGFVRVDVIYRRVDDLFLDPEVFRPDSTVGVPGLMRAWRAGNVALTNAPGAGVADDKVVYCLCAGADPLLPRRGPRYPQCPDLAMPSMTVIAATCSAHLDEMVVKPANESGGYGVFVGSSATQVAKQEIRRRVEANPRDYIAQPIVRLSTSPTLCDGRVVPRHLDLRPFILSGPALRHPGRAHPGRVETGVSCRQQLPGRGQQRHLGHRPDRRAAQQQGQSQHVMTTQPGPVVTTMPRYRQGRRVGLLGRAGTSSGPKRRPG